jgi:hypothetical protein
LQRAERDLARARLTAADAGPDATAAFAVAITSLRQGSTPYHLAHGLLDHAARLLRLDEDEAAETAVGEARGIAQRLRCQPLLDRANSIQPASPRTAALVATASARPAESAAANQTADPTLHNDRSVPDEPS